MPLRAWSIPRRGVLAMPAPSSLAAALLGRGRNRADQNVSRPVRNCVCILTATVAARALAKTAKMCYDYVGNMVSKLTSSYHVNLIVFN